MSSGDFSVSRWRSTRLPLGSDTQRRDNGTAHVVPAAQKRMMPDTVLELLDSLGIPSEKATYVCAYAEL